MNEKLTQICEQFIADRDTIKSTFPWDGIYIIPICAMAFAGRNVQVSAEKLKECRKALEQHTSIFSTFRGNTKLPMVTLLAGAADPLDKLQASMAIYSEMREFFYGSEYLAYISAVMTDMITREQAEGVAKRAKEIYTRMKKEHPFLTGSEDSVYAVLMAFSDKSDDELIAEMEQCYKMLKQRFHDSNSVQALSHVLTLAAGSSEAKCERFLALYDGLDKAGLHYGKYYQTAVLASLSILDADIDKMIAEIAQADEFLEKQKGYGFFSIDRTTRLMHAAGLVSILHNAGSMTNTAATASTLQMIAAQQAAMCAVIASTAAVNSAN